MPKSKKPVTRTKKKVEMVISKENAVNTPKRISKKNIALIVIFLLVALLWKFRSSFIVAMVNGQPISRWQLNDQLVKKFGEQTLESIINERLILSAARQKGLFIKTDEIDNRTKEIETRLSGKMSLDDALKAQGLTRDDFKRQLEIQISIEKLFEKESTISSKEIDDYISSNSQSFKSSTNPAEVRSEVNAMLRQQKINDLFEKWFTEIQKNAKVSKFL